jgi:hypothetical protein
MGLIKAGIVLGGIYLIALVFSWTVFEYFTDTMAGKASARNDNAANLREIITKTPLITPTLAI